MTSSLYRPAELRQQFFRGRDAIEAGLISRTQLASPAWRRLFQGIYMSSEHEVTHAVRCLAVAEYLLPPGGVIAGRSAAAMHSAGSASATDPVEILIAQHGDFVPHKGIVVHRGVLTAEDRMSRDGLPITTPVRTCWDLARWLRPVEAVAHIDQILRSGLVTPGALVAYLDRRGTERPRPRGWHRYASVLPLVDGRAESLPESRLRVRFVLAGLPPPVPQFLVTTDDGAFIARVDLAWPELRVIVEYDGQWHGETDEQVEHDRRRRAAVEKAGWRVVSVTALRFREDFEGIVAEVRAAMRAPIQTKM